MKRNVVVQKLSHIEVCEEPPENNLNPFSILPVRNLHHGQGAPVSTSVHVCVYISVKQHMVHTEHVMMALSDGKLGHPIVQTAVSQQSSRAARIRDRCCMLWDSNHV